MSRRVVVTSVVRYAVPNSMSGWLRVVDLEVGETVFSTLVPESVWRRHDPNHRGGTRGTRGVSIHGDRLVIAGAERLYVFDTQWRLVAELTHRLMADVHDVLAGDDGIWVAATGCDALLLYGRDGKLLETCALRDDEPLVDTLGRPGHWLPPLDPTVDYRDPRIRMNVFDAMHLNGLARAQDGLLLSLGRVSTREEDVGRSGFSLYAVDVSRGERVAEYRLDGVEHEAVYAVCTLPGRFATPRPPAAADPYSFWKRAALLTTVTPIPG